MSDWRSRLALGAVLAVALGLAFVGGYEAFSRRVVRNPSDAALMAQFTQQRAAREREAAARATVPESVVYLPRAAWVARARFADVKGFAFSTRPLGELADDLDQVPVRPRRHGEVLRWHRPLADGWYLYREIGGPRR